MTATVHDAFDAFAGALPPHGPLLGLDLGTKTIGVALSDGLRHVATPQRTLTRRKFTHDAEALEATIAERDVAGLVLGLPLNMDGTTGPRIQATRAFARNLARRIAVPIGFWDERLSTVAAERALLEADASRKRRSEIIDSVAAGYILQGALDRLSHMGRT